MGKSFNWEIKAYEGSNLRLKRDVRATVDEIHEILPLLAATGLTPGEIFVRRDVLEVAPRDGGGYACGADFRVYARRRPD